VCSAELYIVACVSDDGDVLIALHLIAVGPISVSLTAAGEEWIVWLLQLIEPLALGWIDSIPLTKVTCWNPADG
jgi:hypothetical protein